MSQWWVPPCAPRCSLRTRRTAQTPPITLSVAMTPMIHTDTMGPVTVPTSHVVRPARSHSSRRLSSGRVGLPTNSE